MDSRVCSTIRPYFMWMFPLFFFLLQFIFRLWPGLTMEGIMSRHSLNATDFGILSSMYYYSYASMQIPVALILERVGARVVVSVASIILGLSMILFTTTDSWTLVLVGRFLTGLASAVGFLSISKVISEWFSEEKYARMVGLSFTGGLLGAVYGGKPIGLLLKTYGEVKLALALSLLALLWGLLTFLFLKSPKEIKQKSSLQFKDLKLLIQYPSLWLLAFGNLLMVGSLEGFADIWGVPFMKITFQIDQIEAALDISFIFVGMLFGGPILATLSEFIGKKAVIVLSGMITAIMFFTLLLGSFSYDQFLFKSFFFVIGILCCYQVIVFATGQSFVPSKLLGITVAFLNSINMFGGSFFHSVIGKGLDFFSSGKELGHYSKEAYSYALLAIPICSLIGVILVIFSKKKELKNA